MLKENVRKDVLGVKYGLFIRTTKYNVTRVL